MRDHGVDLPDSGDLATPSGGDGDDVSEDPDFEDAIAACRDLLRGVTFSNNEPPPMDPEAQDALLAYAECMRGEDIDMADPTSGGLVGEEGNLPYDPDSQEYRDATRPAGTTSPTPTSRSRAPRRDRRRLRP